jgi:flavin reductase (DIM6/NTAB) family NADH-FMN oxidoreductase RutF
MTAVALTRTDERAETQRLFRQVMGRFATGVTVVTTRLNGETFGMTANAFMAGSLEPMLCVVSINHAAQMHGRLRAAGHYGVSFLADEQQHLAAHFAGKRVAGLEPQFALGGGRAPILEGAAAAVTADVVHSAECGDHTLFVGRITSLISGDTVQPLLFYGGRYARLDSRATLGNPRTGADPVALPEFW